MPPNDHRTVTLEDLVDYAADQEKRIKSVFAAGEAGRKAGGRGAFRNADKAWEDFWHSVWGYKPDFFMTVEAQFDRGDDPIDDFSIESEDPFNPQDDPGPRPSLPTFNVVPTSRRVLKVPKTFFRALGERTTRILIRTEYDEAEAAALSAEGAGAGVFYIAGQSGIGKSVFLFYILIKRLSLKLPTIVQFLPNIVLLFHSEGVYELEQPVNSGPYAELNPESHDPYQAIWALLDSNAVLVQPGGVFTERSPFFVLEASSHRNHHLDWMKKATLRMFCMRTWTFPELAQGRTLVRREAPPTERQLWDLYKTYGASCRHLFDCATDPGRYHSLVQSAVESVEDLVRALTVPSRVTETSHFVLLLEPLPDDRSSCRTRIITRAVFEMVWHKHLKKKAIWAQQFYEIFVEHSFMAVSAGWLFEFRTHYLLRQGRTIRIFLIGVAGGGTDQSYSDYTTTDNPGSGESISFELPQSDEHVLHKGTTSLKTGWYYRPESSTFPTIDALFLFEPKNSSHSVLLMFQITRNKKRLDVKEEGLREVKKLNLPKGTKIYYIAVTPEDLQPTITLDVNPLAGMDVFPVYHYPLSRLFDVPG